jgi:small subunit ribosomal protein S16
MLAIRMQRSGRKGHAMFRVVVQDSRRTPTSGKLVAQLGSYDPHAKTVIVDKEKAQFYLDHGAQPSERLARLFASEGIKLPKWVVASEQKQRTVRNADKRRSTRPEAPAEEAPEPQPEAAAEAEVTTEAPVAEASEETTEQEETTDSDTATETPEAAPEETPAEPAEAETPEEPAPAESEAAPAAEPAEAPESAEEDKESK